MELDRDGLRILNPDDCIELLGSVRVGRIGLIEHALPTMVPVPYEIDADTSMVTFSATSGLLAKAAGRGDIVCFEAACADPPESQQWSVVVVGKLEVTRSELGHRADATAQFGSTKVSLPMTIMTGRATTNIVLKKHSRDQVDTNETPKPVQTMPVNSVRRESAGGCAACRLVP